MTGKFTLAAGLICVLGLGGCTKPAPGPRDPVRFIDLLEESHILRSPLADSAAPAAHREQTAEAAAAVTAAQPDQAAQAGKAMSAMPDPTP